MVPMNATLLSQKTCPAAALQNAQRRSRRSRPQTTAVRASQNDHNNEVSLPVRVFGALAAAQIAFSGAAMAGGLPGSNIIRDTLPDFPKPAERGVPVTARGLKDIENSPNEKLKEQLGKGGLDQGSSNATDGAASKAGEVAGKAGDVAGKAGDVAGKAKSAVKSEANGAGGNPAGDLSGGLPGSDVTRDNLPSGPKPGDLSKVLPGNPADKAAGQVGKAASKGSGAADKAKGAVKNITGDLSGGLPGSNVTRDNLPSGPKPGDLSKVLPGNPADKAAGQVGKAASQGSGAADKAKGAVKNITGDLSGGLPGSNVTRDQLPNGPKPGDITKNLPGNPADKAAGQVGKAASQGSGAADKAKGAVKNITGDLSGGLPGSNVTRDNLPSGPKPGDLSKVLPGNPADKAAGQVGKAASQGSGAADKAKGAVKNITGDLSGGLPGSNVTRDQLPNGPKPGDITKNLPGKPADKAAGQVGKAASQGSGAADKAKGAVKNITGDLSGGLPGSNVTRDNLPSGPKPGDLSKVLPGNPADKAAGQVGKAASQGSGAADKAKGAVKNITGDLSGGLPGSNVTRDQLPNGPKPGDITKNIPGNPTDKAAGQVSKAANQAKGLGKEAARKGLE